MLEVEQGQAAWAAALGRILGALRPPSVRLTATERVSVLIVRNGRAERVVRVEAGETVRLTARGLATLQVEYGTEEDA